MSLIGTLTLLAPEERRGGYAAVAILMLVWLVGLVTSTLMGGLIHLLLIIAAFGFVVQIMSVNSG